MASKTPFYVLIGILFLIGSSLLWVRHFSYNVPFSDKKSSQVWEIEAKVSFNATKDPIKVSLAKPMSQKDYTFIKDHIAAADYGVSEVGKTDQERIEWTKRQAEGKQTLYYTAQMLVDPNAKFNLVVPEEVKKPKFSRAEEAAAKAVLEEAIAKSADNISLTREIIKQFNDKDNLNAISLTSEINKKDAIIDLLAVQNVSARQVDGLLLEDGRRNQSIKSMIAVWDKSKWHLFNPKTGTESQPDNFLIWNQSGKSLLDVEGGKKSNVTFSFLSKDISSQIASNQKIAADSLLNFSIHSLPVDGQAVFKTIMLIPIGALIVVILRVLVGLKTSGTFMPVLIALAFVQTELIPGLIGFILIVGTGLIIRSYLSRLNLLLVARISAVIISVILIISLFSIISYRMGITKGLSITLFPMIILSWTIERMSILWEEDGPKEVLIQGGGSLLTATLVYLAMTNPLVQHLTFNFLGVQFIVLAIILLLGNYTGYRLSELFRFKPFDDSHIRGK